MSRVWVIIKRIGKVLRFAIICLVITICVFMIWRAMFSTATPKELKALTPNEELRTLYTEQGKDIYMFKQNYDEITRNEAAYGYFSVPSAVFIPEIEQAQIVFRYNNSTVRSVAEDYSMPSVPDRESDLFDVTLVMYVDLTPDNKEDNNKINADGTPNENIRKIRLQPRTDLTSSKRTSLYSFYRYTFDLIGESGESFTSLLEQGTLLAIHTDFYYNGDIRYDSDPYGAICIYASDFSDIPVALSGKDKKALEG